MDGRIPLRAMALEWTIDPFSVRPGVVQGIALPDGRFIFNGNFTYSSEAIMLKFNPGARIVWCPSADATINHITPEDD